VFDTETRKAAREKIIQHIFKKCNSFLKEIENLCKIMIKIPCFFVQDVILRLKIEICESEFV
jgi:hypothetical protein